MEKVVNFTTLLRSPCDSETRCKCKYWPPLPTPCPSLPTASSPCETWKPTLSSRWQKKIGRLKNQDWRRSEKHFLSSQRLSKNSWFCGGQDGQSVIAIKWIIQPWGGGVVPQLLILPDNGEGRLEPLIFGWHHMSLMIINRPSVAGAVLQSPPSLADPGKARGCSTNTFVTD
jgi:hypothetical protein